MKIKLCGIKRPEDIISINEYKPDYIGFVFAGTKRRVTPQTAAVLAEKLSPEIKKVGVFVNEPPQNIEFAVKLANLDAVQLHGDEDEEYIKKIRSLLPKVEIWKAVRVKNEASVKNALKLSTDMLLFDSFSLGENGGTGKTANLELIQSIKINRPYFLAGGLNCKNILSIIKKISPYGVDISSGIETGGVKDHRKIQQIMRILRGYIS